MNLVIIGHGTQGKKRSKLLSKQKVNHFIIDPYYKKASFKYIEEFDKSIDCAFICSPDDTKYQIIEYLIKKNVKILVEKPLYFSNLKHYQNIEKLLRKFKKSLVYVAYNHRFEPHIIKLKQYLQKKTIGEIYSIDMYYGNGTARLWKNSIWRQKDKKGVIIDLAPHLLDAYLYLFGNLPSKGSFFTDSKFENRNLDFAKFGMNDKKKSISFTTSLIDWKNKFEINVLGSKGSIHVKNLCKWDQSLLYYRKRKFPSGRPDEIIYKAKKGDPTWDLEHKYFFNFKKLKESNIKNDIKIKKFIDNLFYAKK